ncbi:MAG: hypothetical protein KAR05_01160 [Candidatus Omnitrophica bacterium]|nr:hypothetical protein [Candidatus Omnitrophota bacterium]
MDEIFQKSFHIVKLISMRAIPVLFVVTYLQERGAFKFLDKFAKAIVAKTGFSTVTGKAFVANTGSIYAGGGMLVNMYNRGEISRVNLILSASFAAFPAHVKILLTATGPVVFSLFTFPVALFYVCFSLASAFFRLMVAGFLSHKVITKEEVTRVNGYLALQPHKSRSTRKRTALKAALKRTMRYAVKMVVFVTLITGLVFYLNEHGIFQKLPLNVSLIGLPEKFNVALFSYLGNAYAGMGVISDFITKGELTTMVAIKLLIFCMLCSRPIVAIKESPTYYLGLYGMKNGILLMLFNLSIFSILAVSVLFGLSIWGI